MSKPTSRYFRVRIKSEGAPSVILAYLQDAILHYAPSDPSKWGITELAWLDKRDVSIMELKKMRRHADGAQRRKLKHCQAGLDGECVSGSCPQRLDGEPSKTGRSCPIPSCGLTALREQAE